MFAAIAKIFRNRGRDEGATNPNQRRLIRSCHNDNRTGSRFRRQIAFEKFFDFTPPFADQRDDPDIRLRIPADHAQEHAFPYTRTRKHPDLLALSAGQQGIDRSNTEIDRLRDSGPMQGIEWCCVQGNTHVAAQRRQSVQRMSETVKNTPEHLRADGYGCDMAFHHHATAWSDPLHFPQWHEQHAIFPKPYDFRHHGAVAALAGDFTDLPDRSEGPRRFNDDTDGLSDPARDR